MLHLDASSGEVRIRLPVRPALQAVVPNCNGYANLGGKVHDEVFALAKRWQERGWVKWMRGSAMSGDYIVIDQEISAYRLARMDSEWCGLEFELMQTLEHG